MKNLVFCAVIFLVGMLSAHAQNTGAISGYVKDAKTGEMLIGVTVRVVDTPQGATTNLDGYYTINEVPAKVISVQVSYIGYQTQTKYNVVVRSGGIPDVNFEMEESATQLEDVVVVANPFEKLEETPLSIQRLSPEEIATYPGGNNDIAKVVQSLPGVSSSVGGFRNDVIIRGGAPNENVYYLDGVEIPNINHFATQGSAGGPIGLLNVSFFEGVTLSSSAFNAQYDNVLSGVLQFDQRNGNNREFRRNFRVSSSETAITLEGPILKRDKEASNTSFIASVRRSYLQLLFQLLELPFLPDYWDYQYKLTHKIDEKNEITVTGVGSIDDFRVNILDEFDPQQQSSLEQTPIIKQRTNTVGLTWKMRFKEKPGFMTTTVSQNYLQNDFTRFKNNVNEEGVLFKNDSDETETKIRYNYTQFLSDWTVSGGASFQRVNYTNSTLDAVDGFQFSTDLSFNRYGLFGQVSRSFLNNRLGVSFGVRMDGNSFTDDGNDLLSTLSPRFSASYKLDENQKWSLNGSVGRYYKIPPYTILGFQDNQQRFVNQNAQYIESDHLVVGLEYLVTPASRFSIEGFYKTYGDYPVSLTDSVSLANLGAGFEVLGNEPIASLGVGRTYGLEFLYQKKLTNRSYAILAYTLFKSEYTAFDTDSYLPSAWDSRHLLTFTGGYQLGKNWELSSRLRYLYRTPFAPVDVEATNNQGTYPILIIDYTEIGDQTLDPFTQVDLRIDKKWNFPAWTFNVFFEVQNVLSQQIPEPPIYGLDRTETGQVVTPQLVVQVKEIANSTPLPAIGIVVDF
ncbi:TonB-dependent Receptor Plug Domain [Cyclobacterium xiamenense]|uniref:TonB-dependent Receptor Plug Domain n=1 Tax=Cyclobacterium xiamenense TaxID=1297121 RepID=A0A1H6ZZE8_9BACT|nr:TonB-dependent receptor [Cyclobacterium xiamenense]SEJ58026.1 TonB-dependent Receptor Plug Domain [Cyclobacterium xiamenense]